MTSWYFNYGNDRLGPFDDKHAIEQARQNPNGYCWRQGFSDWLPQILQHSR